MINLIVVLIIMSIFYLHINDSDSFINSYSDFRKRPSKSIKNKNIYLDTYFLKLNKKRKMD